MKRIPLPHSSCRTAHGTSASPAGVTLTEVLISLLVISVAVVSVATLFPLSLLRSVQGRQLTQATILRYNAENLLDVQPNMFSHVDNNGNFQNIQPGENLFIDPLGWHLIWETNPNPPNPPRNDLRDRIGGRVNGLRRFNSGLRNQANPNSLALNQQFLNQARELVSLPDTWIDTSRGLPFNYNATVLNPNLTLPSDVDLSDIPITNQGDPIPPGIARITVFDPTFRFSDVRTITNIDISNNVVTLSSRLGPHVLDNSNPPQPRGEARIEIWEQRYTWLLTVRSSVRSADVVVFFRRSFSTEDERIYLADFSLINLGLDGKPGAAGVDDDNQNGTDDPGELGWNNTDDFFDKFNRTIPIRWTTAEPPNLKRGGYIFDVQNVLWYRIHDIASLDESLKIATLVLDKVIKARGRGGAMLMRGIVDVYPISF